MRINLFINVELKNRANVVRTCKKYFYNGGDWHEFFEVNGIKYCLSKAEINVDDETPDFTLDFADCEACSFDKFTFDNENFHCDYLDLNYENINGVIISTNAGWDLIANGTYQPVTEEVVYNYKPENVEYMDGIHFKDDTTIQDIFMNQMDDYSVVSYFQMNPDTEQYELKIENQSLWDKLQEKMRANWLQILIWEQDITVYEFAQRCGIDKQNLYKIIDRNSSIEGIGLSTAEALAKGLGISIVEFFETIYNRFKAK